MVAAIATLSTGGGASTGRRTKQVGAQSGGVAETCLADEIHHRPRPLRGRNVEHGKRVCVFRPVFFGTTFVSFFGTTFVLFLFLNDD